MTYFEMVYRYKKMAIEKIIVVLVLTALDLSWFLVVHGVFISLIVRDWKNTIKHNAQITVNFVKNYRANLRMGQNHRNDV